MCVCVPSPFQGRVSPLKSGLRAPPAKFYTFYLLSTTHYFRHCTLTHLWAEWSGLETRMVYSILVAHIHMLISALTGVCKYVCINMRSVHLLWSKFRFWLNFQLLPKFRRKKFCLNFSPNISTKVEFFGRNFGWKIGPFFSPNFWWHFGKSWNNFVKFRQKLTIMSEFRQRILLLPKFRQ